MTKKQQEIVERIKNQINITLELRESKKRNYINFEDNLSYNDMKKFESFIATNTSFEIVPNGYKCLAIKIN